MNDIETVIETYGQYIYHFALKLSADPEIAEDISQLTFIQAWRSWDKLRDIQAVQKWLRTICYREFLQYLRKNKQILIDPYETIEDLEQDAKYCQDVKPLPIDEVKMSEEMAKLRDGCFLAMTTKLTLHQRIAFSFVDMFHLPIEEVVSCLEISPKAVKGLLYRARMNLDAFFYQHCSLLDIHNPCQCQAWLDFVKDRDKIQKRIIDVLDYHQKNHFYDEATRQKVKYVYMHLPAQKPSDQWFENMIKILEKSS